MKAMWAHCGGLARFLFFFQNCSRTTFPGSLLFSLPAWTQYVYHYLRINHTQCKVQIFLIDHIALKFLAQGPQSSDNEGSLCISFPPVTFRFGVRTLYSKEGKQKQLWDHWKEVCPLLLDTRKLEDCGEWRLPFYLLPSSKTKFPKGTIRRSQFG